MTHLKRFFALNLWLYELAQPYFIQSVYILTDSNYTYWTLEVGLTERITNMDSSVIFFFCFLLQLCLGMLLWLLYSAQCWYSCSSVSSSFIGKSYTNVIYGADNFAYFFVLLKFFSVVLNDDWYTQEFRVSPTFSWKYCFNVFVIYWSSYIIIDEARSCRMKDKKLIGSR